MSAIKNNKTVCFLGDSITEHGHYTYALRSYLHRKNLSVDIYNCGLGGMRADRVTAEQIEYEVTSVNANYCVISFGVNDLGIWLYDSFLEVTEEVLRQRKERNENFFNGIKSVVKILKLKGVEAVLMSPFPVNELLEEKPDIPTIGDNKEKSQLINQWFYKRKTFVEINKGLKIYNDWLKEYSQSENVKFIDIFDLLRKYALKFNGLFNQDGIHYSKIGGEYIAKSILYATGEKRNKKEFVNDLKNDEIYLAERDDRAVSFLEICHFGDIKFKDYSKQQKKEYVENLLDDPETEIWLKRFCEIYLRFYGNFEQTKKKLVELTKEYLL